jgi:hypothetical protein
MTEQRKWLRTLAAAAMATLLVTACSSPDEDNNDNRAGSDSVNWPKPVEGSQAAAPAMPEVAPTTNCPGPIEQPTRVDSPGQLQGLEASTDSFWSGSRERNQAFDSKSLARMPEALTIEQDSEFDMPAAFQRGAYAVNGGTVSVTLQNFASGTVKIDDVHPVNLVRECLPLAAAVLRGSEGGDPPTMIFNLDAATPAARDFESGELYFEKNKAIVLEESNQTNMYIKFDTTWGAYSFDVAFEYSLDGQKYTALLNNMGIPFRVTTGLCATREEIADLPEEAQKRLKTVRFDRIRSRQEGFTISDQSPEDYAADCPW